MFRIRIIAVLIAVATLTSSCGDSRIGKRAPDFSTHDLRGNEITLSQYRGRVVLLDFWATWCLGCVLESPNIKRVYNKYKDQGFVVIGINQDQNRWEFEAFIRRERIEWPQVFDWGNKYDVSLLYNADTLPAMFLIDKEGILRDANARGERLEAGVKKLLSVNPAPKE
jgi:peroxiredoxin